MFTSQSINGKFYAVKDNLAYEQFNTQVELDAFLASHTKNPRNCTPDQEARLLTVDKLKAGETFVPSGIVHHA